MKQLSDFSTYQTGILQAKAYRNLRNFMVQTLKDYDLTSTEWSILGVASDESRNGGIRVSDLAKTLDVETSFVTNMVKKLIERELIVFARDEDDGRVRLINATDTGHLLVQKIERYMRNEMKAWINDITPNELVHYINVLEKLAGKKAISS